MRSDLVDIEARLVHETEKARLLDFGGAEPVWLPKIMHEWDAADQTVALHERDAIERGLV